MTVTNILLDTPRTDVDHTAARPLGDPEVAREIEKLVRRLLTLLGEDPDRSGLTGTPARMAKSLRWLTRGYRQSAREEMGTAIFEERYDSMILVRDIEMYSLCEHHLLPFFGRVHVAYIPDGKVVGLSKLARVANVYARRLQVQERLTEQIAEALFTELRPHGVGVAVEAAHLCMMMRGVEKQGAMTTTTAFRGAFADSDATRREFLSLTFPRNAR